MICVLRSCAKRHKYGDAHLIAGFLRNEVHFVNQDENVCIFGVLFNCLQAALKVGKIFLQASGHENELLMETLLTNLILRTFDIEHIDKKLDTPENMVSLALKIVLVESVLAGERFGSLISQIETPCGCSTYPPQSQRLRTRFPRKRTCECSTSKVGPSRIVSRAR
jgi:hypothetical protein